MTTLDLSKLPEKSPEVELSDLLEAGVHFGHQSSKWHPKMKQWIYVEKNGVHIFDLVKTAEQLKIAYNAAYKLGKEGKTLIAVGTKRRARDLIEAAAKDSGMMYITARWLGGLLTNWEQVRVSLKKMITIEKGLESGAYDKYTKYERVQLEKELLRLRRFFDGIRDLTDRPDALFVIDINKEDLVIREASTTHIPTIAVVDSNVDPDQVTIPIPANDDGRKSLELIINFVAAGYKAGRADKSK